jgi:hypothetical protein
VFAAEREGRPYGGVVFQYSAGSVKRAPEKTRVRRFFACLLALKVSLPAHAADDAEPPPTKMNALELEWTPAAGCPPREALLERVADLVSQRGPVEVDQLVVQVVVSDTTSGAYSARIVTEHAGQLGDRTLEAASCADLVEGVALVIALSLTPSVPEPEPAADQHPPVPTSQKEPPARETPPAPPKPRVQPEPRVSETIAPSTPGLIRDPFLTTSPVLDLGVIADASFGGAIGGGARVGPVELLLRVVGLPARRTKVPGTEKGADFSLLGAQAGACLPFLLAPWAALGPCAALEGAALRGRAFGTVEQKRPVVAFAAAAAGAFARLGHVGPIGFRADGLLLVPLNRPTFFLKNVGDVRTVPILAGRFGLGVEVAIP